MQSSRGSTGFGSWKSDVFLYINDICVSSDIFINLWTTSILYSYKNKKKIKTTYKYLIFKEEQNRKDISLERKDAVKILKIHTKILKLLLKE